MFRDLTIERVCEDGEETRQDTVACEAPFTINVNKRELVTLLCSPKDLDDLVRGFLFSSGLIRCIGDIEDIVLDTRRWVADARLVDKRLSQELFFKRMWTSGCGRGALFYNSLDILHRGKITSDFRVGRARLVRLAEELQVMSDGFKRSGGVHCAGLSDGERIVVFREDIGRHNALDKALGAGLRQGLDFSRSLVLTSGRLSSEIVLKAKKGGIPIITSRSAPTDQAVKLARDFAMTLVGFVRGRRMNIYAAGQRVSGEKYGLRDTTP
ncbi:MAG: formate dehydrogenase accessory sulfurtransferase FdhD [Candidatus Omnitrophota bacterium]